LHIIAVDDEQFALRSIQKAIREALPDDALFCFSSPDAAYEYAQNNDIDVAFLDISMGDTNGLKLAEKMQSINERTNIIFVTGHSEYAVEAVNMHASGYLLKPVTKDKVLAAVKKLRRPPVQENKRLRVQCFGNFEVFVDKRPLIFARAKTKELFAYLVYREGALCNNNEIAAVLWEDKDDSLAMQSHYRHLVADMTKTLNAAGVLDVLIKIRGSLAIVPDKFHCDLYDYQKDKNPSLYRGEFMMQYSWAERVLIDRV
jgi:two-component SAPR family response regulator